MDGGWVLRNGLTAPVGLESDWVRGSRVTYQPGAMVMLQQGEHRVIWEEWDQPVVLAVSVRGRRRDDARIPYLVDNRIPTEEESARRAGSGGTYLGVPDAPMTLALRYRLAVLFRHLLEGETEPLDLVRKRAVYLGITVEELDEAANRYRRRLNAVLDVKLGDLYDLGQHLHGAGEIEAPDLDP